MKLIKKYLLLFSIIITTIIFFLQHKNVDNSEEIYMQNLEAIKYFDTVVFFPETSTYFNISDLFIAVKTTYSNHKTRMNILLDTWISSYRHQTYIFTDKDDLNLTKTMPDGHVINTGCRNTHHNFDLSCKLGREIETFVLSRKKWFCHVDDDCYLNMDKLMETLGKYNFLERWYLGKSGLDHPWHMKFKENHFNFWFGTGGAGFCLSGGLRRDLWLYARPERLLRSSLETGLADDVALAFVIHYHMKVHMTTVDLFHSHIEHMPNLTDPLEQITISYEEDNIVNVTGFDLKEDPSRFKSVHCHLHPTAEMCKRLSS